MNSKEFDLYTSFLEDLNGETNYSNLVYLIEAHYGEQSVAENDVLYLSGLKADQPTVGNEYSFVLAICLPGSKTILHGSKRPQKLISIEKDGDLDVCRFENSKKYPLFRSSTTSYAKLYLFKDGVGLDLFLSAIALKFKTTTDMSKMLDEAVIKPYQKERPFDQEGGTELDASRGMAAYIRKHSPSLVDHIIAERYGVWRGAPNTKMQYFVADPSTGTRSSANTTNYYTVIMDNSPAWDKFPKRSKSFICSASDYRAEQYGGSNVYLMVPHDGVKLGICPYDDVWETRFKLNVSMPTVGLEPYEGGFEWPDANTMLKEAGFPQNYKGMHNYAKTSFFKNEVWPEMFKSKSITPDQFMVALETAMAPSRTGFQLGTAEQFYAEPGKYSNELWFSGPCLAIHYRYVNEVRRILKGEI